MNIIKWLINDFKTDIAAFKEIGEVISGKRKLPESKKEKMKDVFLRGWGKFFLKPTNYMFFLILILSFLVGWHYSSIHYQNECNDYIFKTYIEPQNNIHERLYGFGNTSVIDWEVKETSTLIFGFNVS